MMKAYWRGALAAACFGLCLTPSLAADKVTVGVISSLSDAAFYIAADRGYFKDVGIDVEFVTFDSAAKMIAPLATGDLDVGTGASSAGLFNAAARSIDLKIVADRSGMAPGYQFMTLMIRKALVDSGEFKGYADLKGKKIALASPAISPGSGLNEAAKKGGLTFADVEKVYLGYPQQVAALTNGAIDGSMMIEPFATRLVETGVGVRFSSTEDFYPGLQIALVYYGEKFTTTRKELAQRFMVAYVRAMRDYNDVVKDGLFTETQKSKDIVSILAKRLGNTEADIKKSYVYFADPNGKPNVVGLQKDLDFFRANGDVKNPKVKVEDLLDLSFIEAAVKQLGPYVRSEK